MDKVCEELDEVKAELEKQRTEYKSKAESLENLRKAHNEQLIKVHQANLKLEKQARELNEKAEEISVAQQMCEYLKFSLKDKESVIQHLRAANDILRVDCDEKCRILESTNKAMVLALDEANEKNMHQEQKISAYKEEMEGLKSRLSVLKKKCSDAEKKAGAPKEVRERDDVILRLEEDNQKIQDQLKWKREQFTHLEEAHEKLRGQFKESKKEWEVDKSSLLDEISSLQTSLDSQTRISDDLQNHLQRCNQALAHEEGRRKYMEAQVSEFQSRYENVSSDREDAKSQVECLAAQRDKEIASLRESLSTKEARYKEMGYQTRKLQQENEELRISLKELQEAHIQSAPGSPSVAKLRSKLKSSDQMHKDCIANHRAKEVNWSSQLESMTGDLRNYKSELESKDAALKELKMEVEQMHRDQTTNRAKEAERHSQLEKTSSDVRYYMSELASRDATIKELTMELEACESLSLQLQLENEELSVILLVLKLGISEAASNETQQLPMEKELFLNQQASQMEGIFKRELREARDALERANIELAETICEGNEIELELHTWKSTAERLRSNLETSLAMRRELEASLLAQVDIGENIKQQKKGLLCIFEEKDTIIDNLQQKIGLLEQQLESTYTNDADSAKTKTAMCHDSNFLQIAREKDNSLEKLEKEVSWLEQESLRREFTSIVMAQIGAEKTFEHEKERLIKHVQEKYQRVIDLTQLVESLEDKFNYSLVSFSSQLAEKQAEIDLVHEAWEKITTAEIAASLEIEEKKMMVVELEEEACNIQQKLQLQEKSLCESKQQALEVEPELETKEVEVKRLTDQMKTKLLNSDSLIEELKIERRNLLDDVIKLSSEKENLMVFIEGIGDKIGEFSSSDKHLMGMLETITLSFDNRASGVDLKWNDELVDPEQENVCTPTTIVKISEAVSNRRSPFRHLNS